jgi:small multidrug resistance pump
MLLLVTYALISGTGLILIKLGLNRGSIERFTGLIDYFRSPEILIGGILYLFGFFLWIIILKRHDISVAYAVAVAALIIVTTIGGILVLGDMFTLRKLVGLLLMLIGILLVFDHR